MVHTESQELLEKGIVKTFVYNTEFKNYITVQFNKGLEQFIVYSLFKNSENKVITK